MSVRISRSWSSAYDETAISNFSKSSMMALHASSNSSTTSSCPSALASRTALESFWMVETRGPSVARISPALTNSRWVSPSIRVRSNSEDSRELSRDNNDSCSISLGDDLRDLIPLCRAKRMLEVNLENRERLDMGLAIGTKSGMGGSECLSILSEASEIDSKRISSSALLIRQCDRAMGSIPSLLDIGIHSGWHDVCILSVETRVHNENKYHHIYTQTTTSLRLSHTYNGCHDSQRNDTSLTPTRTATFKCHNSPPFLKRVASASSVCLQLHLSSRASI
jgi:hypothetical protein